MSFPLMYGLDNIWKSGIWGCKKKNLNIEKISFEIIINQLILIKYWLSFLNRFKV